MQPRLVSLIGIAILAGMEPARADEAARDLSLADAVRIALASDADLYIAREDTRAAADEIKLAESAFSPRLFGEAWWARTERPPGAFTFGGVDTVTAGEVGIAGRIGTGMQYSVATKIAHQRTRNDPFGTVYDPASSTSIRAEVIQPLMRGSLRAARRPITVAAMRRNRSELELRARIETTIAAVENAYWNLVRARSEREARQSAVALAKDQVVESKRITKLGTGSELDVVEAEAGVSRRTLELLRSEQGVVEAEGKLLAAMGVRAGDAGWVGGSIAPTDTAKLEPAAPPLEAQLQVARAKRSDALASRELIAAETAALGVTGDLQRPGLDLVVAAGTVGFAGTLAQNYATAGVNGGGLNPPFFTDPAYDGGLGKSFANIGRDLDFYVGLRFDMPLGAHEAKVRHSIQQRTVNRARLAERATQSLIDSEVRTAASRVALDLEIVTTSDEAVVLAEKLLEGMRKRFRAGAATSFDVLRVSDELTRARVEAGRARADYRVSVTRLAAATGTLLDGFQITIKSLAKSP